MAETRPNKRVIVTGSSSGIGLGIALAFLEKGAHVVLVSRSLDKMQAAVPSKYIRSTARQEEKNLHAGRALFLVKDLTTANGCQECISEGVQLLEGHLDILVNNAGAGTYGTSLKDLTVEDWDWLMNVNLRSVFICSQTAIPHLTSSKGNVINISSIASKRPMAGAGAYCVSKAGVDMLTQQFAIELASQGVRVNAINPATVCTNFHTAAGLISHEARDDFYEAARAIHPIGRVGQPQDVSHMALFLADDQVSGWVTGQCIVMDGGRLLISPKQ